MAEELRDGEPVGEPEGFGDQLRRQAAVARQLAQLQREIADDLADMAARMAPWGDQGIDAAAMSAHAAHAAQGLDQVGSLHAEAALAHDDMIAAGGPENSRAYVEYEATIRRNLTLWPGPDFYDS